DSREGDGARPDHRRELHPRQGGADLGPLAGLELMIEPRQQHAEDQCQRTRLQHGRQHHLFLRLGRGRHRAEGVHFRTGEHLPPHDVVCEERADACDQPSDDPMHTCAPPERECALQTAVRGYLRCPGTPSSVMARRSSTSSRSLPLSTPFSITSWRTVTFFATASLASLAASAYPIFGASAVTSAGLRSSQCAHCARSASIPATQRSASTPVALVSIRIEN